MAHGLYMSQVSKYGKANVTTLLYTISCSNPHKHLLIDLDPKDHFPFPPACPLGAGTKAKQTPSQAVGSLAR